MSTRMKDTFDFNDMLMQFATMRRMRPLQNVLKMIPGLRLGVPKEPLENFKHVERTEAIILSMTPLERSDPDLIDGSRRARIATGSGRTEEDVSNLIVWVYEMRRGY